MFLFNWRNRSQSSELFFGACCLNAKWESSSPVNSAALVFLCFEETVTSRKWILLVEFRIWF